MTLPDENTGAVDRLVQWLYTDKYQLTPCDSHENATDRYWELAKLNLLADKYDMKKLKNNIIDKVYDDLNHNGSFNCPFQPPFSVISFTYDNTSEHSSFRKLMMAWLVWHSGDEHYRGNEIHTLLLDNSELAADLAMGLGNRFCLKASDPFRQNRTLYYEDYDVKVKGGDANH